MVIAPGLPPLLSEPLWAIVFFAFLTAAGRRLTRMLGVPARLSPWERAFLYPALGAGIGQYPAFCLGQLGLLSPRNLVLLSGSLALFLLPDLWRCGRAAAAELRKVSLRAVSPWLLIWGVTMTLFVVGLLLRSVVLTSIVEDDGYHLTAPKRWLESGALDYLPTYTHTNAPMGFEMLYTIALAVRSAVLPHLLHLGAGIYCLSGVILIARRVGAVWAGLLAVSCALFETRLIDVPVLLNQAYADFAVAWLAMAALLLWCIWREQRNPRLLACAALCAGFAGSFKFTAVTIGAALGVLVLLELRRQHARLAETARSVALTAALAIAPILPWLFRNWRVTGNPLYPMLASAIPTRDWSARHAEVFQRFFRYYNWASDANLNESQRKHVLLVVSVVLIASLGLGIVFNKRVVVRELLVFTAILVVPALAVTGLYTRFLLPAILCSLLVIALALESAIGARRLLPVAALALLLSFGKWAAWARHGLPDALRVATGLDPQRRDDQFWNTWSYLNEHTPPDASVLMGAFCSSFSRTSGMAFWVDRKTYTTDSHLQSFFRFDSWQPFLDSIQKAHVDFAVIAEPSPASGPLPPTCSSAAFFDEGKNEYPFVRRLVTEYGSLVYSSGRLEVYKLRSLPDDAGGTRTTPRATL